MEKESNANMNSILESLEKTFEGFEDSLGDINFDFEF